MRLSALFGILFLLAPALDAHAAAEPRFDSQLVSSSTPGHAVEVDAEIAGAERLYLVVTDGGDGFGCDWADWAEPRLVGPQGTKKLTELRWKTASAAWGQVRIGRNAGGGPLRIAGKAVSYGIGTHANSIIEFELPEGYTRFKARGGLDEGGTRQGCGSTVQFLVYTERPPAGIARASAPGGTGGDLEPAESLASLDVADGLDVKLFASEPMLLSPSNIDVDHLGRVWVCEVVNYRHFANKNNPVREEGDRILILEDADGDGRADKQTVFYQGRDIDSAHGVCVLGDKVIVSALDKVLVFTDEDGDRKADRKDVLFSGIAGAQHDHGIHAFVFGPDGKLYFNFGNAGKHVRDKDGNPIVDAAGNVVDDSRQPYQEGMVFRCNLDGTHVETLGWNFRNNWEVCVDSFGTLWQSDNDDDGNRGVRINYVMEFGNYGYKDEFTGAGWKTPRTGMHPEIPLRHWHQNDPGVVPNLLQTGAGSPTGICVYEGTLLPEVFRNQVIHCDAGPNVVRCYPVQEDGAGYEATVVNILEGASDKWFRPSDVCVAPDGSLLIADWYDPGVGGHRMGDVEKGRIFRVAPPGAKYTAPKIDVGTVDGAVAALKSPNHATRYLAWTSLSNMGEKAEAALAAMFQDDPNPRFRARALWLLSKMPARIAGRHVFGALKPGVEEDLRIVALRAIRQLELPGTILPSGIDHAPKLRRELFIMLRGKEGAASDNIWARLAKHYVAGDRWELEALGIGAEGRWNERLKAWLELVGDNWNTPAGRDIIWRSRAAVTPEYLVKIIADPSIGKDELPRYLRALDFQSSPTKDEAVMQLAFATPTDDPAKRSYIVAEAVSRLKGFDVRDKPEQARALDRVLDQTRGTDTFVELVDKFNVSERYPELLALADAHPDDSLGVEAIRVLLQKRQRRLIAEALEREDPQLAAKTIRVLGNSADGRAPGLLLPLIQDAGLPAEFRQEAVRGVAKSRNGALRLLELARAQKLDESLKQVAAFALHSSNVGEVKQQAAKLFPLPPARNQTPLPPLGDLLKSKGDAERGRIVFNTVGTCAKCHVVNGEGKEVGPNLSEIGKKLSREALFESILFPSAGVSHNYETYTLVLESGNVVTGVITTQTPESVTIKGADAIARKFDRDEIEEIVKQRISLMPADLQKTMTAAELIDVIEYMQTLKEAQRRMTNSGS